MSRDQSITREQQRARGAALQVEQANARFGGRGATQADEKAKPRVTAQTRRYNAYAHALPIWIRTNGLLQTVAFLEAKARTGDAAKQLVGDLGSHLREASFSFSGSLSQALCTLPYDDYVRWQEEAVRCAAWIKRFSAALIGELDPDAADSADEDEVE